MLPAVLTATWEWWTRRPGPDGAGPTGHSVGQRVLVAVANPASAEGLVRVAAAMASGARGRVEALAVLVDDDQEAARSLYEQTVSRAVSAAIDSGAEADGHVRVDVSVGDGILHRTVESDATLVVLGWPATDAAGSIAPEMARVAERSPSPLILARLYGFRWTRVVVVAPDQAEAGGRASARLATEIAQGLARVHDLDVVGHEDRGGPIDPAKLRVIAVPPEDGALRGALAEADRGGDVIVSLCHGAGARQHRELLAAAERLYVPTPSPPG